MGTPEWLDRTLRDPEVARAYREEWIRLQEIEWALEEHPPEAFFESLKPLGTSKALDMIFNTIDDRCIAGHYDWVDTLLASVPVEEMSLTLLIGFLTITLQWKSKLMEREDFFAAVREKVEREAPDRIEGLLGGL